MHITCRKYKALRQSNSYPSFIYFIAAFRPHIVRMLPLVEALLVPVDLRIFQRVQDDEISSILLRATVTAACTVAGNDGPLLVLAGSRAW